MLSHTEHAATPLSLHTCCTLPYCAFVTTPQHQTQHDALLTESTLAMLSSQLLPQQQEQAQQQHSSSQATPG